MALIDFNESLLVGIPEIDNQHKHWIDLTNNLYASLEQKSLDVTNLNKLLTELFEYAKNHFSLEESYFAKYNYNDSERHIKEHRMFIVRVEKFMSDYKINSDVLPFDILSFMANWFVAHIKNSDMQYKKLFTEKSKS